MNRFWKIAARYGAALLVAGGMAWLALWLRDYTGTEPPAERYMKLCDAFTIPGVSLTMLSALIALANAGSLTGVGYMMSYLFSRLIPGLGVRGESYADYLERKSADRVKGYGFILHVGLLFLGIAVAFLVLFYQNGG